MMVPISVLGKYQTSVYCKALIHNVHSSLGVYCLSMYTNNNVTYSLLTVPFPPTDVQLSLKFVNEEVNINATWMVSSDV